MRKFWISLLISAAVATAGLTTASAQQPPHLRRKVLTTPSKKLPPKGRKLPPKGSIPPKDNCSSRRMILGQETKKLDTYRADLTEMNTEIAQLQRRLRELQRDSQSKRKQVENQQMRVDRIRKVYKSECEQNETCNQYEAMATSLEDQTQPLQEEIGEISREINDTRRSIASLRQRIDPLQREYHQRTCSSLVPGQTRQETIDRCMGIFSEWNRLQRSLNRYNSRLSTLKSRHQRYLTQLNSLERRANSIEAFLSRNCKGSKKVAKMRQYRGVRTRALEIGKELDALIEETRELKELRIQTLPAKQQGPR